MKWKSSIRDLLKTEFDRRKTASKSALLSIKCCKTTPFDTPAISPTRSSVVPLSPNRTTASNAARDNSDYRIERIDFARVTVTFHPMIGLQYERSQNLS